MNTTVGFEEEFYIPQTYHKVGEVFVSDQIHFDPKIDNRVFKVMPFSRFYLSVKNEKLVFASPATWDDPFEKLFYIPKKLPNDTHIYALCTCYERSENEEAVWKSYQKSEEPQVRITINLKKLIDLLDKYSVKHPDIQFYVSLIDYSYDTRQILSEHASFKKKKIIKVEEMINYMCIKRRAYSYENEVRIFAVVTSSKNSEKIYPITIPNLYNQIITGITLPPYPLVKDNHKDTDYQYIQDVVNQGMRACIERGLKLKCRIWQSRLFQAKYSHKKFQYV